jgi:hypothetical protein
MNKKIGVGGPRRWKEGYQGRKEGYQGRKAEYQGRKEGRIRRKKEDERK